MRFNLYPSAAESSIDTRTKELIMGSLRRAAAILAALAFTLCKWLAAAQDFTQSLVLVETRS